MAIESRSLSCMVPALSQADVKYVRLHPLNLPRRHLPDGLIPPGRLLAYLGDNITYL